MGYFVAESGSGITRTESNAVSSLGLTVGDLQQQQQDPDSGLSWCMMCPPVQLASAANIGITSFRMTQLSATVVVAFDRCAM